MPEEEAAVIMDLDPRFAPFVEAMLAHLRALGFMPYLIWGRRSQKKQGDIVEAGNSQRMDSAHLHGLAVDIVDLEVWWAAGGTDAQKARTKAMWKALGDWSLKRGLTWGGTWTSLNDPAHVEWADGASLAPDEELVEALEEDTQPTMEAGGATTDDSGLVGFAERDFASDTWPEPPVRTVSPPRAAPEPVPLPLLLRLEACMAAWASRLGVR